MATNIPTNTPLQQQIDEFIAEGASWLPTNLLQDLLRPIGQLMNSGAAENALKQDVQARGASLVAISPQTPHHSRAMAEKLKLTFALLSDMGNQVARQFGLVFTIDEAVRAAHKQVCADLPAFNGENSWELPMAGTFLIDQSGTVRLAFIHPDFTRRLDPSVVIARLNELQGEKGGSSA